MKKSLFLVSTVISLCFCSCENFLSGTDLKNTVDQQIDYAQSPYINVTIESDFDATKTISPAAGEYAKSYKNGDYVSLKYQYKDTHIFNGWKCMPEGAVEFSDSDSLESKAVLKTSSGKVKIYPETLLIPAAESFYPPLEQTGFPQDTSIVIRFNKEIDLSYFDDFNNISISADDVSLISSGNKYFQKPVAVDSRTLEIKTVSGKNILIPGNASLTKDIKVVLSLNDLKDKDNIGFKSEILTFGYKINGNLDNKPPVIVSPLKASKVINPLIIENNIPADIPLESFETFSARDDLESVFEQHHVGANITLTAQFKDEESGVKVLRIKEKILRKNDSSVAEAAAEFITEYSLNSDLPEVISYNKDTKTYFYAENYSFQTPDDGVIGLNIEAEDYAGNITCLTPAESPVEVIKDTYKILPEIYRIGADLTSEKTDNFDVIISCFYTTDNELPCYFKFNGNSYYKYGRTIIKEKYDTLLNKINYQLYISTDEINWTPVELEKKGMVSKDKIYYPACIFNIDRDTSKNLYFKYAVHESAGGEYEGYNYCIEKSKRILNLTETSVESDMATMNITVEESAVGSYFVFVKEDNEDSSFFVMRRKRLNAYYADINNSGETLILPNADFIKDSAKYSFYVVYAAVEIQIRLRVDEYFVDNGCSEVKDEYKENPLLFLAESKNVSTFFDQKDGYLKGDSIIVTTLHGNSGEPFIYNTVNQIGEIEDRFVPKKEQIIITEKPVVPDSLIHEAVLSYTDDFIENPDYLYIIREIESGTGSIRKTFYTKDIYSVHPYITYFEVVVYDGKGNEKHSELIPFQFTGDIQKPSLILDYNSYSGYTDKTGRSTDMAWKVTPNRYESVSEIKEDDIPQIKDVSYLLSDNPNIKRENYSNFNFEPCIRNDRKFSVDLNGRNFNNIYIAVSDLTGNTFFDRNKFKTTFINDFYKYEFADNSINLTVPEEYFKDFYTNCHPGSVRFILTDLKSGKQINTPMNSDKNEKQLKIALPDDSDETFIKIESEVYSFKFYQSRNTSVAYFPYTTYFCPGYEKAKNNDQNKNEKSGSLKNVIKGEMGLSILCDQPVYVHTLYSVTDYGCDVSQNEFAVWETKGYEAGKGSVKNSSFTYDIPVTPEGYWYTTIVHFADGTVYQTTPVKK